MSERVLLTAAELIFRLEQYPPDVNLGIGVNMLTDGRLISFDLQAFKGLESWQNKGPAHTLYTFPVTHEEPRFLVSK